jgi:hypothetical protein
MTGCRRERCRLARPGVEPRAAISGATTPTSAPPVSVPPLVRAHEGRLRSRLAATEDDSGHTPSCPSREPAAAQT